MAQTPAATMNQNGFGRKIDDMNNHLSSSPRRTAIGKPSLRLSIPTIEQIAETKIQAKLNQTDADNKKADSFVKRMIDNCNHSGQLQSNIESNDDTQTNCENAADVCDANHVKSVIEKLDKNKRMSITNGKSPTDAVNVMASADDDTNSSRKPSIEIHNEDNNAEDKNDCIEMNGAPNLDNFLSYSKFENDFQKRINELNSGRLDAQTHGTLSLIINSIWKKFTITIDFNGNCFIFFLLLKKHTHTNRSPHTIAYANKEYFYIDTKLTVAHPEATSQQDCQPESHHSLQIRATHCKWFNI